MAGASLQGNKAQLALQLPMDKLKVNGYLCLWGLVHTGLCFFMAGDKDGSALWYFPATCVIIAALFANAAIYSDRLVTRLAGYYINLVFHVLALVLVAIFAGYQSFRLAGTVGLLWWWNPALQVIRIDKELTGIEEAKHPRPTKADELDVKPGWDAHGKRLKK